MSRLIIMVFAYLLAGCTKTVYIPVESVRTEYQDRYLRDSVYVHDSTYIREKGDSVLIDRWHTLYREVLKVDSFLRTDSIQVPYPVDKIVEVNKLYWFQKMLIWIGVGAIMALMLWLVRRKILLFDSDI